MYISVESFHVDHIINTNLRSLAVIIIIIKIISVFHVSRLAYVAIIGYCKKPVKSAVAPSLSLKLRFTQLMSNMTLFFAMFL